MSIWSPLLVNFLLLWRDLVSFTESTSERPSTESLLLYLLRIKSVASYYWSEEAGVLSGLIALSAMFFIRFSQHDVNFTQQELIGVGITSPIVLPFD